MERAILWVDHKLCGNIQATIKKINAIKAAIIASHDETYYVWLVHFSHEHFDNLYVLIKDYYYGLYISTKHHSIVSPTYCIARRNHSKL